MVDPMIESIRNLLRPLDPTELQIEDESDQHV